MQIWQEFQEIEKSRRKTCCLQKGRGKKREKELRGVESLPRGNKKGKEIRDPRKGLKVYSGGISVGRSIIDLS